MSLRPTMVVQLQAWDDEAWAALANRGLLRRARKDLDTAAPRLVAEDDASVTVEVGPHLVVFDPRGPAHARCSCPTSGTCQHVVTAGLWLASSAAVEAPPTRTASTAGVAPSTAAPSVSPTAAHSVSPTAAPSVFPSVSPGELLHGDLMALADADLVAHAGRAGHRWAYEFAQDLDLDRDVRITRERHIVVTLGSPRVTFRYMGGGPSSLVPDTTLPRLERYQAAVVLLYQRAHGQSPVAPHPPSGSRDEGEPLEPSRARLRATVTRLLLDTVQLGLSHQSTSMHERFASAAVWAQGSSYHRLALLLRRIADQVELLLARAALADERRLLDDLSTAHALVAALEAAAARGAAPSHLVGQSRQRYDLVRRMDLVGLGSLPWRTGSGYRGLTTLFWWPEEQRFVSLTDARPESLGTWDPRARHGAPGPWAGLACPAATTGARVVLSDAQLSPSGRLSGVERTHAVTSPRDGAQVAAELPKVTSFRALEGTARRQSGLLSASEPLRDWAVLAPAVFGPAFFDPSSQVFSWVVSDGEVALTLTVPYSALTAPTIAHLEQRAAEVPPEGTLVVCRVRVTGGGLAAEPLSLVHPGRGVHDHPVDELHFPPGPTSRATPASSQPVEARPAEPSEPADGGALPLELVDLVAWHHRHAERGTASVAPTVLAAELGTHHQRLRDKGFSVFPAPSTERHDALDVAHALLASHLIARQLEVLLVGADGESD